MSLNKIKLSSIGVKPDPDRVWMVAVQGEHECGPLLPEEVLSLALDANVPDIVVTHLLRPNDRQPFTTLEPELLALTSTDKRQGLPRSSCRAEVLLQMRDQTTIHGRSIDLASFGMLLRIDTGSLQIGSGVNLVANCSTFIRSFTTRARVARKAADHIYGIEFLEPGEDAQRVIEDYLIRKSKAAAA